MIASLRSHNLTIPGMKNSRVVVNEFIFSKISKYITDALMCGIVIAGENVTLIIEDSYTMPEGGVSPP